MTDEREEQVEPRGANDEQTDPRPSASEPESGPSESESESKPPGSEGNAQPEARTPASESSPPRLETDRGEYPDPEAHEPEMPDPGAYDPESPDPDEQTQTNGSERTTRDVVVVLTLSLVLVLGLAVPVFAMHETILDESTAIAVMDDEGVPEQVATERQESAIEAVYESIDDDARPLMTEEDEQRIEEIVTDAITEAIVREELVRNIELIYGYIHGSEDDVVLFVNLTEPRGEILAGIEEDPDLRQMVDTDQLREEVPAEQNMTADGTPPDELGTAQTVAGWTSLLRMLLSVLVVGLLVWLYRVTKSIPHTAMATGAAFTVSGILAASTAVALERATLGRVDAILDNGGDDLDFLVQAGLTLIESFFSTMVTIGGGLAVAGIVLLVGVYADSEGYLEGLKQTIGTGESVDSSETPAEEHTPDSDVETPDRGPVDQAHTSDERASAAAAPRESIPEEELYVDSPEVDSDEAAGEGADDPRNEGRNQGG